MRQTPTTILRERFPAGSSQTSAPELISSSAHTDAFFAFSHPTGWFRGLTCTLISEERRTCPPYSSLSQTYRTASPHIHIKFLFPLSLLLFLFSTAISHLVNTENRDSSTSKHCQLSLWYLVSGKTCPIKRCDANNITLAPILAESPAPTTNQAQEPCPSG